MANMLNINGSDDPSYRYKMPKLVGKIEGRGNGIKTVIVNASDVAQALHRPTSQVTKFFGCELGAMSRYEDKTDRAVVNGAHETSDLQEKLFLYVNKFVLCGSCNNPETEQVIKGKKKNASISLHCIACGADSEADNQHKLCTTIINEHFGAADTTTRKRDRKNKKKKDGEDADGDADGDASVASSEKDKKEKKAKKDKKSKKEKKSKKDKKAKKEKKSKKDKAKAAGDAGSSKAEAAESSDSDSEAEFGDVDSLTKPIEALSINDAAAIEDSVNKLRAASAANPALTSDEVEKQVLDFQSSNSLRKIDALAIWFFALVADQLPAAVPKYMGGLAKLAQTQDQQLEVLSCLEESVARAEDDEKRVVALKLVPLILKVLYDEDVVDEDTIMKWHKGSLKPEHVRTVVDDATVTAVKTHAQPIITWLEEVESEDESEDEDGGSSADGAAASAGADGTAAASGDAADADDAYDPTSVFGTVNPVDESDTESDDSDDEE